jgi:hypothetical protein
MRTALSGYNGFNLVAFDFRQGECFYASNDGAIRSGSSAASTGCRTPRSTRRGRRSWR